MKVKEYIIVNAVSTDNLQIKIEVHFKYGFEPYGNPFYADLKYHQALIRREEQLTTPLESKYDE